MRKGGGATWEEAASPIPVKDSSLYKPFTKLIQDRLAVSLTAAKILALQGTQDQGIMKMEPKEEQS